MVALLAVGELHLALPESLSIGPHWLLLSVVGCLMVPTIWGGVPGNYKLNRVLGYVMTAMVTLDMGLVFAVAGCGFAFPQGVIA